MQNPVFQETITTKKKPMFLASAPEYRLHSLFICCMAVGGSSQQSMPMCSKGRQLNGF